MKGKTSPPYVTFEAHKLAVTSIIETANVGDIPQGLRQVTGPLVGTTY